MRSLVVIGAVSVVVGPAVQAEGATERDTLVRPGRSIAGVALGMTEAQVRKLAGKPDQVTQEPLDGRRVEVTYVYGIDDLTVRFVGIPELFGKRRPLPVVRVGTHRSKEKLPNGVRVGMLERRMIKLYGKRLHCPKWKTNRVSYPGSEPGQGYLVASEFRECVLPGPDGAETAFVSRIERPGYRNLGFVTPDLIPTARVWEISVRPEGARAAP